MQLLQELFTRNQEIIIQCVLLILTLISVMLVIRWSRVKPILTTEEVFSMPKEKQLVIKKNHIETRYLTKKVGNDNKDLNRYGRFSITYENGDVKTKIGRLSDILSNSYSVGSYREIK